jgi:hypothetical protein
MSHFRILTPGGSCCRSAASPHQRGASSEGVHVRPRNITAIRVIALPVSQPQANGAAIASIPQFSPPALSGCKRQSPFFHPGPSFGCRCSGPMTLRYSGMTFRTCGSFSRMASASNNLSAVPS